MRAPQNADTLSAVVILLAAAAFALLLAGPGVTITTSYVNDLFIFLDGAHRIASGQVPNRDFHTALGPLTFYIPAVGYWLSETMGGAMPSGMAAVTLLMALPISHILSSRLRAPVAVLYGLFLLIVLAVPMNLGESVTELSFGMFYNRIGWAALGALLVMYLTPGKMRAGQTIIDAVCAAFLALVMLYTKITYGIVALAFLAFMLLDRRHRLWVIAAISLAVACSVGIEAVWQSTFAYFDDLILTSQVSGSRGLTDVVITFLRHLADYTLLAILMVLVLRRTRSLRDLIFFSFCIIPGLLIQNQNAQPWGILTIHAGAAVAVEILLRSGSLRTSVRPTLSSGAYPLLIAILLPTFLHCFLALSFHTALGVFRYGQAFPMRQFAELRLISPWLSEKRTMMNDYLDSVGDGARILEALPETPERVTVLDFSNPFSAGLDLKPSRGDSAWLHWQRNISSNHFIPAEELFSDVHFLMIPKWGINPLPLMDLYRDRISEMFELAGETKGWLLYRRKSQELAIKATL